MPESYLHSLVCRDVCTTISFFVIYKFLKSLFFSRTCPWRHLKDIFAIIVVSVECYLDFEEILVILGFFQTLTDFIEIIQNSLLDVLEQVTHRKSSINKDKSLDASLLLAEDGIIIWALVEFIKHFDDLFEIFIFNDFSFHRSLDVF